MKNKKIAALAVTTSIALGGIVSVPATAEEKEGNLNISVNTTTDSAVEIRPEEEGKNEGVIDEDVIENEIIENQVIEEVPEIGGEKVSEIKVNIEGEPVLGEILKIKVNGYDEQGNEVKLDKDKLVYTWILDGETISNAENIEVSKEMIDSGKLDYKVDYKVEE